MKAPNFILKIIRSVDGSARICELVRFHLEDITLKEAGPVPPRSACFRMHWRMLTAAGAGRKWLSALHFKADLTLGLGSVAFDYMAK